MTRIYVSHSVVGKLLMNFCQEHCVRASKGRVQKPPARKRSVNFFPLGFRKPTVRGGGGVPPLSVKKKSIKNWPKNGVFWAKTAVFGEKNYVFGEKILFSAKKIPFSETDRPWRGIKVS